VKKILLRKVLIGVLGIMIISTSLVACDDKGKTPVGNSPAPQLTPAPQYTVDKTPVKILTPQKKIIDQFSGDKNGKIVFKETRKPINGGEAATVFEDTKYKYVFTKKGDVNVFKKDFLKDIQAPANTKLAEIAKFALAETQKLAPVTASCTYKIQENRLLNPKLPEKSLYYVVVREMTAKSVFTGSFAILEISKNKTVIAAKYVKGDATIALSQTAKISKSKAIQLTKDFISQTYKLTVGKIQNAELLVFEGKLAWGIDFFLAKGTTISRQKMDAITGAVLSDAIATRRNTMTTPSPSPAP